MSLVAGDDNIVTHTYVYPYVRLYVITRQWREFLLNATIMCIGVLQQIAAAVALTFVAA